ncbi:MAG: CheR family methyltransferase [Reyranellales bacterium]
MARTRRNGSTPPEPEEEKSAPPVLPVVGVGASAGGLTALESLLPAIPTDSGLAFVVVQHLDPDHESSLAALLQRLSPIPVSVIKNETAVEPNHLYVIPPNASLTLVDDRLQLASPLEHRGLRTPIDGFFVSLAEARGEKAAGIILSGSGSDGTLGLRAIKEHGGLTIAQEGAEYDGMMRSAVSSGMVDFVLPLHEIPAKLAEYFHHIDGHRERAESQETGDYLTQISALLRTRTGHDFSGYKDKTVARRVQRRMQVLQIDTVPEFIDRLRKEPAEVETLLQDLLIGVTNFFRDPQAFAALEEQVIPQLFEGKGPDDTVRVWVPGCSTGEEAYSIAILLREHMPTGQVAPKLQIFASDIDEQALQVARTGRYPATIARDIPANRLERYFVREDGTYRIASDLRELCLFSSHNLLRDAPFSKLDLVSCRNLLIYFTPELQNRLIPLFHYALNESGHLFLGSSENLTRHTRLFATVDKPHRIFRRRAQLERRLPEFPLTAPEGMRRRMPPVQRVAADHEPLQSLAERQLLDRYSPAYVIINAEGDVLHGSSRTGKYLELPPGVPKIDIFSMGRQGLRSDLRAGVHKAIASGQVVVQRNVLVGTNGGRQMIDLVIQPLRTSAMQDPLYMVVFQDIGGIKTQHDPEAPNDDGDDDLESAGQHQLDMELRATKERLQTTTEELESANEELKSGNEELSSMNEELQSANEELETSKEELQSINEELQTVNSELNARVEELSRANSDIANLLESTQIATVFLDHHLNVKNFTPSAKDIYRLVESDTGRPISHVRSRFQSDTVQEDAERVMRTLATIERQIESTDTGARYGMRMMPYRTVDNVIAGVVITFVDVTKISAAEARINELTRDLRDRIASLETLLDVVPVGILIVGDALKLDDVQVNRHGARLLGDGVGGGADPRRLVRPLRLFQGERELRPDEQPVQLTIHSARPVASFEGQLLRADGERRDVMITSTPLFDEDGKVRGAIAAIVDISDSKNAEARQQVLLYELQHRVKNIIATISALAGRTLRADISPAEFVQAFQGRLRGMARTHELLSRSNWAGAPVGDLVESTLRSLVSLEPGAFKAQGPEVLLTPNAAATLGMVIYELATNAVKYGGLAQPPGRLDVHWQLAGPQQNGRVELVWTESGGRDVPRDLTPGFGLNFITRSIEYEMQGKAEREPAPGGLRWTIEFPVAQNVQRS